MRVLVVAAVAAIVGGAAGFWGGWEVRERRLAEEIPNAAALLGAVKAQKSVEGHLAIHELQAQEATDAAASAAERAP